MPDPDADPAAVVTEHLAAFNAHDSARLVAGLADDIVWITGRDTLRGRPDVSGLFDDWLWGLDPSLTPSGAVLADGDRAAVEAVERLTVDGEVRSFAVAIMFTVRAGLLTRVKVYREGSADL